ncbi:MAG: hypothetical protein M1833_003661 [Piccolia ochrophora]|nr:MAG: hypothetical protein M1833_003661 [Piccolia ochrophora]
MSHESPHPAGTGIAATATPSDTVPSAAPQHADDALPLKTSSKDGSAAQLLSQQGQSQPARSPSGLQATPISRDGQSRSANYDSKVHSQRSRPDASQADLEPSEQSNAKRSNLDVPSPSSTLLTGVTVGDSAESIGRGSRGSISARRRGGSRTSSQRTASAHRDPAYGPEQSTTGKDLQSQRAPSQKSKQGGFSRFLAFLNCCGVPKGSNSVADEDTSLPPKRAGEQHAEKGRQTTPLVKQSNHTQVADTAHLKGSSEEKSSGVRDSDKTDVSMDTRKESVLPEKERAQDQSTHNARDNGGTQTSGREAAVNANTPSHLPTSDATTQLNLEQTRPQPQPSNVTIVVEQPTPRVDQGELLPSAEMKRPNQDHDIDMPDAPPSVTDDNTPDPTRHAQPSNKSDAPPPSVPPETPYTAHVVTADQEDSSAATPGQEKQQWLLPPIQSRFQGKKCLVLDLDETLVHSSFKILHQADFTIPVEIEGQYHNVYVIKRPGVDQFMKRVGELYEVVVFTASVSKYGDPLLDQLDIHHVVHHRLFRESCYNHQGNYVKDLSQVGRDLRETIIIDNSPTSYIFHPQHAVPISSWFSDAHDNELLDLIPVLEDLAGAQVKDVSLVLDVAL